MSKLPRWRRVLTAALCAMAMGPAVWIGKMGPRLAASRALVAAYAVAGLLDLSPTGLGPAAPEGLEPALPRLVERRLQRWWPAAGVRVVLDGTDPSPDACLPVLGHERPDAPASLEFAREAQDLLAAEDPLALAAALRSLTPHDRAALPATDVDPAAYLRQAKAGRPMTCLHFAVLYGALAGQQGYTTRVLGLRDPFGARHAVTEIYVPRLSRWILVDVDFNVVYRRAGVLLNAAEVRDAWRAVRSQLGGGPLWDEARRGRCRSRGPAAARATGVEIVALGEAGAALRASNLEQKSFTGMNLEFFEAITYAKRDDHLSGAYPWGHPLRWGQYALRADATTRASLLPPEAEVLADPDPLYAPVGRCALFLEPEGRGDGQVVPLRVATRTPNFARFERRIDGGTWVAQDSDRLEWRPHPGLNSVEIRSVNAMGLRGEAVRLTTTIDVVDPG